MLINDRTAASTFDRVAIDLTHEAFREQAAALRARSDRILKQWRDLRLKAMPHLDALTIEEFENSIAIILAAAADALQSADPQQLEGLMQKAPKHGVSRFVQENGLLDLFEEARILRGVIITELAEEMQRPLVIDEAATFHAIFDIIIQQGAMALVENEGDQLRRFQRTMRGINEQLFATAVRHDELLEQATTAQKALLKTEERLAAELATTKRLAAIVESSDDAIISKDLNGIITTWNHGAQQLFGYTAEEAIGRSVSLLIPEDHLFEEPHILDRVGRGESIEHYETVRRRKDGSLVNISLTVSPIRDAAGRVNGASKIARDTTDRVAMEKRIKQQAEDLAGESRRKDEFLAMLSHELRNPLAPIRSALHLLRLQERPGSENAIQQEAREVIERQIGNLTKLVSDLLEVARVVSGRIWLDRQTVDLNQVIKHAVETVAPMIEQRKHALTVNQCSEPIWCDADPTRMEEVFINLLTNAAKYSPDGGRIEVWCEQPQDQSLARVRVRDYGLGIDPDLLPRIFDLFTQADRSLARSAGGLGIGLSLAHRLVHLHGGSIEAQSPPEAGGAGSEFIVRLARTPAPRQPQRQAATVQKLIKPEGVRVLVVDDNIDSATMLATLLRHSGYSVQSAYTGPDALKIALQWRPDIVLLDIGLPGLDGYEVAQRLRSDPSNVGQTMRLIALTGYGRDTDIALAREAGFDAHMVKPIDSDELEKVMVASEHS